MSLVAHCLRCNDFLSEPEERRASLRETKMPWTLTLPDPQFTDLGLTWQFDFRGYSCKLVASNESLRLWMDGSQIDPRRVLLDDELAEGWGYISQLHILEYMILPRPKWAAGLVGMVTEVILRRSADVKEGLAPLGYGTQ